MRELFVSACIAIGIVAPIADTSYVAPAAASYVIHTYAGDDTVECCGNCVGGIVTHADGHTTLCPCPDDCPCKKAVTHSPVIIKPKASECPGGQCKKR